MFDITFGCRWQWVCMGTDIRWFGSGRYCGGFEALGMELLVISLLVSSHQNSFHHALCHELMKTSLKELMIRFHWISKTPQN